MESETTEREDKGQGNGFQSEESRDALIRETWFGMSNEDRQRVCAISDELVDLLGARYMGERVEILGVALAAVSQVVMQSIETMPRFGIEEE